MMRNPDNQEDIFLVSEGDNWYLRNKPALNGKVNNFSTEFVKERLVKYKPDIHDILEIGCSNALKLESLTRFFASRAYGIDPSKTAIADAQHRFSSNGLQGEFSVGVSSSLPFESQVMDLVFLGFFLYLVETNHIGQTLVEVDRVLKPGGFLVIEDFDPGLKYSKEYIHNPVIKTYKDKFSNYFVSNFDYYLTDKVSYSHSGNGFEILEDERISTQILYKPIKSN